MFKLEQVAIDLLQYFGIVANRIDGYRGVWIKDKKIASIGIGVKKWVSFHGMAINVNTDLTFFKMINPCGLNVQMTSMRGLLGQTVDLKRIKKRIADCFCTHFNLVLTE